MTRVTAITAHKDPTIDGTWDYAASGTIANRSTAAIMVMNEITVTFVSPPSKYGIGGGPSIGHGQIPVSVPSPGVILEPGATVAWQQGSGLLQETRGLTRPTSATATSPWVWANDQYNAVCPGEKV